MSEVPLLLIILGVILVVGVSVVDISISTSDKIVLFQDDLNVLKSDLNVLKVNDFALANNQSQIFNALVLNDLGESGCQITSQTQIDVNSFAVSLICPVKEVK